MYFGILAIMPPLERASIHVRGIDISPEGDVRDGSLYRIQPEKARRFLEWIPQEHRFPVDHIVGEQGLIYGTPPRVQGSTWGPMHNLKDIWLMHDDTLYIATHPGVALRIHEASGEKKSASGAQLENFSWTTSSWDCRYPQGGGSSSYQNSNTYCINMDARW